MIKSANKLVSQLQIESLRHQIMSEEAERSAPGKGRAEEEYFLARLVADAERKEIARLQNEVRDLALPNSYSRLQLSCVWGSLMPSPIPFDQGPIIVASAAGPRGGQETARGAHES